MKKKFWKFSYQLGLPSFLFRKGYHFQTSYLKVYQPYSFWSVWYLKLKPTFRAFKWGINHFWVIGIQSATACFPICRFPHSICSCNHCRFLPMSKLKFLALSMCVFSGADSSTFSRACQLTARWPHYADLHSGAWWLASDFIMEKRQRSNLSRKPGVSENSKFWRIQFNADHRIAEYLTYWQLFMFSRQLGGQVDRVHTYQCSR